MSSTYIILALITSGVVTFCDSIISIFSTPQSKEFILPHAVYFGGLTTSDYYDSSCLLFKGYFVYKRTIWNSRTHCSRNCSVIAVVEREYAAEYLCPNGHLHGVIASDVKLTYMLIEFHTTWLYLGIFQPYFMVK